MKTPSKYNASLQAGIELPDEQRLTAERKYLEFLELAFGSASKVRGAYCEYVAVRSLRAENPWDAITSEESHAIVRWEKTAAEATQVVFRQLNITDKDAFFELHVWNSRTN